LSEARDPGRRRPGARLARRALRCSRRTCAASSGEGPASFLRGGAAAALGAGAFIAEGGATILGWPAAGTGHRGPCSLEQLPELDTSAHDRVGGWSRPRTTCNAYPTWPPASPPPPARRCRHACRSGRRGRVQARQLRASAPRSRAARRGGP
jgi:hypothetical protein